MKTIRLILSALTLFCMVACNSGTNQSDTENSSKQSDIKCTFDFKLHASAYNHPYSTNEGIYHIIIYNDNRVELILPDIDTHWYGYMEEGRVKSVFVRDPTEDGSRMMFVSDFEKDGNIYRHEIGAISRDPNDVVAVIFNYKSY